MSKKYLELKPSNVKTGTINLPGSKSISNRVLLISSLSEGTITINNLLFSDDTKVMISVLKKLGVQIKYNESLLQCTISGSKKFFPSKKANLYVGNAGTVIRPLTAVLAFNNGNYILHGNARMHERPIRDLVDSLNSIGAKINYLKNVGFPPISINNSKIKKNSIKVKGSVSSQFLTSLLISSPLISRYNNLDIEIIGKLISQPYVNLTLELLKLFNLKIKKIQSNKYTILANQNYRSPKNITIEGDASSSTYFLAAATISGTLLKIKGVGNKSIQGDFKFIDILKNMGAVIKTGDEWIEIKSSGKLKPIDSDFNDMPDAAMTAAILALYADGPSTIANIASWKVKETDRLSAMSKELRKLGAIVTKGKDYLKIQPPTNIKNATIDTYDDHRMAMCFSLASLNSPFKKGANIKINDPKCVAKTFPNYFEVFNNILD